MKNKRLKKVLTLGMMRATWKKLVKESQKVSNSIKRYSGFKNTDYDNAITLYYRGYAFFTIRKTYPISLYSITECEQTDHKDIASAKVAAKIKLNEILNILKE